MIGAGRGRAGRAGKRREGKKRKGDVDVDVMQTGRDAGIVDLRTCFRFMWMVVT